MAEQAEREDDDLELDGDDTQPGADIDDTLNRDGADDSIEGGDAGDEVEVIFGDEAAPASDEEQGSDLIRQLRAANREQAKKLAAYERGEAQPMKVEVLDPGPKPKLEDCYEADDPEAEFETRLDAWKERKAKADDAEVEATKLQEQTRQAWQAELEDFGRKKAALKVRGFAVAEEEVASTLNPVQLASLIQATDDSAKVVYALGRHPEKLKSLAAITNPVKFIAAIVKLEGTLKVTTRRKAPEPDVPARGSGQLSASSDKELERLEKEAERTGDRSKVIAHKRRLRAQGRS